MSQLKQLDRNIWIRFVGEMMTGIAGMMLFSFYSLYLSEKLDSLTQVGIVMAVSPIASVFASMVGGRIADVYGRKPIMMLSPILVGFVMFGFIIADGLWFYVLLSFLMGLAHSLFHPAASAMVADVTPPEKLTEAFGLLRMGHNVGAAIGPLLGMAAALVSKELIFIVSGCAELIYAAVVFFFIRETLPATKPSAETKDVDTPVWQVLLRDKVLFIFIGAGIVISAGFSLTEGMLPVHFKTEMDYNPFPYLMSLNGVLVVLCQFAISRWAGKYSFGRVMMIGTFLFGTGLVGLGILPRVLHGADVSMYVSLVILLALYAYYTFGEMVMSPVQMTFIAEIAPEHLRGTYNGAASLQWILGGTVGPLLGGYFFDQQLGMMVFTVVGVGCVVSGLIYMALDRYVKRKEQLAAILE